MKTTKGTNPMQEPKPTNLKSVNFPKMVSDLMHSNYFLKAFSYIALFFTALVFIALLILMTKDPVVITLDTNGRTIDQSILPEAEDEIREAIKKYLEKRYDWSPEDVFKKLKDSEEFIHSSSVKAFRDSVANIAKFSVDKIVVQKVYPSTIGVNLSNQTALVMGDRITTIQGFKAAGDLKLELSFISGSRTKNNPWGIYITKEREE